MMAVILALAEVTATPLSIVVLDAGPAHDGCPNLELTQRAVSERVRAESESGQWSARYVVTQSSVPGESEIVRLELSDPEGRVRLRREFALAGEDCEHVAEAIALVLERYFADLAAESELPPASEAESPTPELAPWPSSSAPSSSAPAVPAEAEREQHLRTGLGGVFLVPDPLLTLELQVRFDHEWWSTGLRGAVAVDRRHERVLTENGQGDASLSAIPLRLWFAADKRWGPLEVSLGPEFLVSLERGTTVGVTRSGDATRVVLGVGAQGTILIATGTPFSVALSTGGDMTLPLAMSQFLIGSIEQEVLKPRLFEGYFSAGFVVALF
jgi:hypothetical protein